MTLFLEQVLNGLQLGVTLFLLAAGLTLVFGIMGVINLAHGALYMTGAFVMSSVTMSTGSFLAGMLAALAAAAAAGALMELVVIRRLYRRDHLDQVLATFGLILFFNELASILWGRSPLYLNTPPLLQGLVEIIPGVAYPVYRLAIVAVGAAVALLLYVLITRSRLGMLIRAGATHREMVGALGVDIRLLYTLVFAFGALLAGLAGVMAGPLTSVEVGMGESILILTFVVVVIGGVGSVRGAFAGALIVGVTDTLVRAFLPGLLRLALPPASAAGVGSGLASMSVYIVMAAVLLWRPGGLFPAKGSRA